jgi:hypothetical protein
MIGTANSSSATSDLTLPTAFAVTNNEPGKVKPVNVISLDVVFVANDMLSPSPANVPKRKTRVAVAASLLRNLNLMLVADTDEKSNIDGVAV